jgi:hypothetical protein
MAIVTMRDMDVKDDEEAVVWTGIMRNVPREGEQVMTDNPWDAQGRPYRYEVTMVVWSVYKDGKYKVLVGLEPDEDTLVMMAQAEGGVK